MRNFFKILKFEYLTCVKNKAFIIITVFLVCGSLLFSLIPGIITAVVSDENAADKEKTKIIAVTKSSYSDDLVKNELSIYYPDKEVKIIAEDRNTIEKKVDDDEYAFAIDINSPVSFVYITKNNSIYNMDENLIMNAVQKIYTITQFEKSGMSEKDIKSILDTGFFSETVTTGTDQTKNYLPVYLLMCVLFVAITSYGQLVTQSVVSEKNTRAMELLITCGKPAELMFGKVIGAGLAGLSQLAVIFLSLSCSMKFAPVDAIPEEIRDFINFTPDTLLMALLFFLLGYFIYAFLLGALASFASKSEDLNGLTTPVLFVMMGVYFIVVFICSGDIIDSTAMTVLSYIPLSAPMAMFVRATLADIPFWEVIISVALQIITIYLFGILAAAIYKIGVLMYGNPPKPAEIIKMLKKNKDS